MVRVRLMDWKKIYVLPATADPNIPKCWVQLYVVDYNEVIEVQADWSDNVPTLKTNIVAKVKEKLGNMYDDTRGEYDYNPVTNTLSKVS